MFRGRYKLAISLTPESISVAKIHRGAILQAERIDLDPSKWAESWSGGLHAIDQPLRQVLARVGGIGKRWDADLFYTSPESICRVEISKQGKADSVSGMVKSLKQTVGRSNQCIAECIYNDDTSSMAIGVADTDLNLQKLYGWLNRNKINTKQILPLGASIVHQAARQILIGPENTVVLHLASRSSVIGYCENGQPKFIRLVDIGYNSIADVYRQCISDTAKSQEQESTTHLANQTVDGEDGEDLLFRHGIPISKSGDDQEYAKLAPAMAPVLQRMCVEIKQTLRFVSSIDTAPSNLLICGPGASIPNIATAMGHSLDLHVKTDSSAMDFNPSEIFGYGTDGWSAACDFDLDMKLLPKAAIENNTTKDLEMAIRFGGAFAVVFICGQFFYALSTSNAITRSISEQSNMIQTIENDQNRRRKIQTMASTIGAATNLIKDTMGDHADWVGVLGSMPEVNHEVVRIFEIQGRKNSNKPTVNLTGSVVVHEESDNPNQILSNYVQTLKTIDSVRSVEIGSTKRFMPDESTWGLNFELNIEMEPVEGKFSVLASLYSDTGG